jgi:hypothetical protein
MKANAATMSRRRMLTAMPAAVVITGGAAVAEPDPVFAAIERHRRATQAWQRHNDSYPEVVDLSVRHTKAEIERETTIVDELLKEESDARLAWATTRPTTMAGIMASLEYASMDGVYGMDTTPLFEGGSEQFPAMIAAALRQIMAEKAL